MTLAGISNENEFYTEHYVHSILEGDLRELFSRWGALDRAALRSAQETPRPLRTDDAGVESCIGRGRPAGMPPGVVRALLRSVGLHAGAAHPRTRRRRLHPARRRNHSPFGRAGTVDTGNARTLGRTGRPTHAAVPSRADGRCPRLLAASGRGPRNRSHEVRLRRRRAAPVGAAVQYRPSPTSGPQQMGAEADAAVRSRDHPEQPRRRRTQSRRGAPAP